MTILPVFDVLIEDPIPFTDYFRALETRMLIVHVFKNHRQIRIMAKELSTAVVITIVAT